MKVKLTTLMLGMAAMLASCSQDDGLQQTTVNNTDGLVPVTLSASIDNGLQTRAVSEKEDVAATRCQLQIMEGGYVVDNEDMTCQPDGSYTTSVILDPTKSYTFLFWADGGNGYYDAADLTNVTIAPGAKANEVGIAWKGKSEWDESKPTNINVTLTHAVTKVTLKTTSKVTAGTPVSVTLPNAYTGYNVNAATVTDNSKTENGVAFSTITTDDITPTDGTGAEVFSFYALVKDETQDLTLQTKEQPTVPINSVPLAQNKHVILLGNVADAGMTTFEFTAKIDNTWGVEGLTIAFDGTYIVSTPKALLAWADAARKDLSLNCTLAADIDMAGTEWTPIGSDGNYYSGTFDGGNHTISNFKCTTTNTDAAMFYAVGKIGKVENLILAEPEITSGSSVAGIVDFLYGIVENCHVRGGSIKATGKYAGGIVHGLYESSAIIACTNSANVSTSYSTGIAGGIVTSVSGTEAIVVACSNTGEISTTNQTNTTAGGIIGNVGADPALVSVWNKSKVTGNSNESGAICGYKYGGLANSGCYWEKVDGIPSAAIGTGTLVPDATEVDGTTTTWESAVTGLNEAIDEYNKTADDSKKCNYKWQYSDATGLPELVAAGE